MQSSRIETKDHPLQSSWKFYLQSRLQKFDEYTKVEQCVKTVEDFWVWWNEIHDKANMSLTRLKNAQLKLFIMRDDILPEWEHAENRKGGILTLTCTMPEFKNGKSKSSDKQSHKLHDKSVVEGHDKMVYDLWQNCVLSMVGETFYRQEKEYETMRPTGISVQFGKNHVISIKIWFSQVWWTTEMEQKMTYKNLPNWLEVVLQKESGIFATIACHKF